MSPQLREMEDHWSALQPLLVLRSEEDYARGLAGLEELLDEVGTNEAHPLYEFLDTLGTLLHAYEEAHVSVPAASAPEVLGYLMEEHGLSQSDLPEVGSQGVISELLRGKRDLNVRQIRALAERFGVSPAVFL